MLTGAFALCTPIDKFNESRVGNCAIVGGISVGLYPSLILKILLGLIFNLFRIPNLSSINSAH